MWPARWWAVHIYMPCTYTCPATCTHQRRRGWRRAFGSRRICDVQLDADEMGKGPRVITDRCNVQVIPKGRPIPSIVQELYLRAAPVSAMLQTACLCLDACTDLNTSTN